MGMTLATDHCAWIKQDYHQCETNTAFEARGKRRGERSQRGPLEGLKSQGRSGDQRVRHLACHISRPWIVDSPTVSVISLITPSHPPFTLPLSYRLDIPLAPPSTLLDLDVLPLTVFLSASF